MDFMKVAIKEAKKAYKKKEVPVGVVIVKDNKIIAKAYNKKESTNNPLGHAEILAIRKACKKVNNWRLDNCTMYVTLEPCLMCTGAIKEARLDKVIYGAIDEKNGYITMLDKSIYKNIEYEYIENNECKSLLKEFFKELRKSK